MKEVTKMIHLRMPNNKGVVSFMTSVDWDAMTLEWSMVVCSKKDTFVKKVSKVLCATNPLREGTIKLSKDVIDMNDKLCMSTNDYLKRLVLHDALIAEDIPNKTTGEIRHTPKWAKELIALDYVLVGAFAYGIE